MFGGMNPAKMQGMMKKMGIAQNELPVRKVIFEMADGQLVIDNPSVVKVSMQGQVTYQVSGEAREESLAEEETFSEDDVKMVIEKTSKSEEEVKEALEKSEGDIAEAIIELSQ